VKESNKKIHFYVLVILLWREWWEKSGSC